MSPTARSTGNLPTSIAELVRASPGSSPTVGLSIAVVIGDEPFKLINNVWPIRDFAFAPVTNEVANEAGTSNAIKSDAQVSVSGEDINTLEWLDGNPTNITNKQILDKQKELQALEDVISKRIKEYGSIAEQIEYITENGLDAWQSKVNSIKAKYPKE